MTALWLGMLCSAWLNAGGVMLYEIGTPDIGLATAGWAARANDAGTAFTNPAGMTRLQNEQVLFGAQPLYQHIKFDPDSQTTVSGTDGDASTWFPAGGFYFVKPLNNCVSIGAAALSYFGAALDYGSHWVGRYYLDRALSMGFSFVPGAAYRINDHLSVGLSANVMYSVFRTHSQVNNVLDGLPDGSLRVTGEDWGIGAVAGILYEFDACTRIGVQYVSEIRQKYNMKPAFLNVGPTLTEALTATGLLNSRVSILSNIPNWVMVSAYRQFNSSIAVMGNIGWQQWSRFARAEVQLDSPNDTTLTVTPKFQDTWHAALGMEYFFNACSKGTLGIAYDSSMVSNKNRSVNLPVGSQWRFGAGYQYDVNECANLTAAYELMWSGDLKLYQNRGPLAGTLSGKFSNLCVQFLSLSVAWNF